MASFSVFVSFVVGLILFVPGVLGLFGALPRNDWVGIRMAVVMRDDETWEAAHRAGGPWLVAAGVVAFLGGSVILVRHPDAGAVTNIETIAMVSAFLLAGIAAWRGQAAARRIS